MDYSRAYSLAEDLKNSDEYQSFCRIREIVMENDTKREMIKNYHQLKMKAQAGIIQGKKDEDVQSQLKSLSEFLQFDEEASEFLFQENRVNRMISDIYKILADAVEIDLSFLEA